MQFRIYGSITGADLLWSESWPAVVVRDGVFSVLLGSDGSPIPPGLFTGGASRYLEVEIEGEVLTPRQQLGAVGWSARAEAARDVDCVDCIDGSKIADGSVSGADVQDGSIAGADIANRSISSADVAIGGITGTEIADGSVAGADIADRSISTVDVALGAITGSEIADGSITGTDIAYRSITSADIAVGGVSGTEIADGSITGGDIANFSIGLANLATASVNGAKIQDHSISAVDLSDAFGVTTYGPWGTSSTTERLLNIGGHPFCALGQTKLVNVNDNGTNIWCRVFLQYESPNWVWYLSARSNGYTTVTCEALCVN